MAYNRFYTQFTDDNAWQYTLLILPSNANSSVNLDNLATLTSYNLIELPNDFLMRNGMTIETELGEIPAGLVSQVMNIEINIAALQGTNALDELRECILRGTVQNGYAYQSSGYRQQSNAVPPSYARFNTFILLVNDGSGDRPVFIGCQKYSAENELTISKLNDICKMKIECFDVFRTISEQLNKENWKGYFDIIANNTSIDYGNSYSAAQNTAHKNIEVGTEFYYDANTEAAAIAIDSAIDKVQFYVNTFANLKAQIDTMMSECLRGITWNVNSSMAVPVPFAKAWTFYAPRISHVESYGGVIQKPAFVNEILLHRDDFNSVIAGGAIEDSTAFGKYNNFYEVFTALVENSLEIYRINYAYSYVSGSFSMTYTADFIRPLTGSGITFDSTNIYSEAKFKLFQETVKSAETSVSTLQGEKDTKSFPYQTGTSSDNGKDVELIFHNLPSPSNRYQAELDASGRTIFRKNAINCGMIIWNDSGALKKVDTQCKFNYSNTQSVSLNYDVYEVDGAVGAQMILEQQQSGLPLTAANAIVTALGDSKQCDVEFKTRHSVVGFEDVGTNCTINLNDLNPLITKIYNANTGTGVITKHKLDVYSSKIDISVRMYG